MHLNADFTKRALVHAATWIVPSRSQDAGHMTIGLVPNFIASGISFAFSACARESMRPSRRSFF